LLDENKKILAKRINVEQLTEFIKEREKKNAK
jgi:predicted nucleotide-binding protein (sugar kinase/HSP70/actin superfamily)